jgi:hypothetical protein
MHDERWRQPALRLFRWILVIGDQLNAVRVLKAEGCRVRSPRRTVSQCAEDSDGSRTGSARYSASSHFALPARRVRAALFTRETFRSWSARRPRIAFSWWERSKATRGRPFDFAQGRLCTHSKNPAIAGRNSLVIRLRDFVSSAPPEVL